MEHHLVLDIVKCTNQWGSIAHGRELRRLFGPLGLAAPPFTPGPEQPSNQPQHGWLPATSIPHDPTTLHLFMMMLKLAPRDPLPIVCSRCSVSRSNKAMTCALASACTIVTTAGPIRSRMLFMEYDTSPWCDDERPLDDCKRQKVHIGRCM